MPIWACSRAEWTPVCEVYSLILLTAVPLTCLPTTHTLVSISWALPSPKIGNASKSQRQPMVFNPVHWWRCRLWYSRLTRHEGAEGIPLCWPGPSQEALGLWPGKKSPHRPRKQKQLPACVLFSFPVLKAVWAIRLWSPTAKHCLENFSCRDLPGRVLFLC